ncbi:MAG: sugar ABC transporter permease [Chloroflexota bacterium]|nr:sugar ABC transporter permease [Chloroflexota bacterium]
MATTASVPKRSSSTTLRQIRMRKWGLAYAFMAPAIVLYAIFVLNPTLQSMRLAFYDWNGVSADKEWVGLDNFRRLLRDDIFWQALQHNLIWTTIVVGFNVVVGLGAAAMLASSIRGRLIFRLGFFLPVVQASIVTAMIWKWMYAPNGILNSILEFLQLGALTRGWLGDFTFALPSLAVASGWMTFGLSVVILLAGMQGVDRELYDAAQVDGANRWQVFFHITLPSIRNVVTIVVILTLIDAFRVFDLIWATTQGGPIRSTEVLATYMFKEGFQKNQYGYGSAIAVVLSIIILVTSVIYATIQERADDT